MINHSSANATLIQPNVGPNNELPAVLAAWGLRNSSPREGRDRTPTPTGLERVPISESPPPSIIRAGIVDSESGRNRAEDRFAIDWLGTHRQIIRDELEEITKSVQDVAKRQVSIGSTNSAIERHLVDLRQIILEGTRTQFTNYDTLAELITKFEAHHHDIEHSLQKIDELFLAITQVRKDTSADNLHTNGPSRRSNGYNKYHSDQSANGGPLEIATDSLVLTSSPLTDGYDMRTPARAFGLGSNLVCEMAPNSPSRKVSFASDCLDARQQMVDTKLALEKGMISDVPYEDFVDNMKANRPKLQTLIEAISQARSAFALGESGHNQLQGTFPKVRCIMASSSVYAFVLAMILLNSAIIAWQTDAQMERALSIYFSGDGQPEPTFYKVTEVLFCCIFAVELLMRVLAEELAFVLGPERWFNLLDSILVITAILELTAAETVPKLIHMRLSRALQAMRALRLVRAARFLRELRVMLISTIHNMMSLMWAFVYLFFVIFLFSCIFLQAAANFVEDAGQQDLADVTRLRTYFDTMPQSLCSLFMSTSGGVDWSVIHESLKQIGDLWGFVFIFYVAFSTIGVLNVIVGIFVVGANASAQLERDVTVASEMQQAGSAMEDLRGQLQQFDATGNGTLTEAELTEFLESPPSKKFLSSCDIDINEARCLYKLLALNRHEAPIDEFVTGLLILKGGHGIHTANQWYKTKQLMLQIDYFMRYSREHFVYIEQLLRHFDPQAEFSPPDWNADRKPSSQESNHGPNVHSFMQDLVPQSNAIGHKLMTKTVL